MPKSYQRSIIKSNEFGIWTVRISEMASKSKDLDVFLESLDSRSMDSGEIKKGYKLVAWKEKIFKSIVVITEKELKHEYLFFNI